MGIGGGGTLFGVAVIGKGKKSLMEQWGNPIKQTLLLNDYF